MMQTGYPPIRRVVTGHDEAPADANGEGPQTTSGR